jgi:hypothetical protein
MPYGQDLTQTGSQTNAFDKYMLLYALNKKGQDEECLPGCPAHQNIQPSATILVLPLFPEAESHISSGC